MAEEKAKMLQVLGTQSGTSTTGKDWEKTEVLFETLGDYPKKFNVELWGEVSKRAKNLKANQTYNVFFNLESREYNSKWYLTAKCWKIDAEGAEENKSENFLKAKSAKAAKTVVAEDEDFGDLPF
jgi:hypothetical protein